MVNIENNSVLYTREPESEFSSYTSVYITMATIYKIEKRCCDAKLFDFIIFSSNKIVKMSEATCFIQHFICMIIMDF